MDAFLGYQLNMMAFSIRLLIFLSLVFIASYMDWSSVGNELYRFKMIAVGGSILIILTLNIGWDLVAIIYQTWRNNPGEMKTWLTIGGIAVATLMMLLWLILKVVNIRREMNRKPPLFDDTYEDQEDEDADCYDYDDSVYDMSNEKTKYN